MYVLAGRMLIDLIRTIHQASRGTYGAPRVHAELVYGNGISAGHNSVSLLMRRAGLAGLPTSSRGKRSRKLATVTDLVRPEFRRGAADTAGLGMLGHLRRRHDRGRTRLR
jgi:hypothetical protein